VHTSASVHDPLRLLLLLLLLIIIVKG